MYVYLYRYTTVVPFREGFLLLVRVSLGYLFLQAAARSHQPRRSRVCYVAPLLENHRSRMCSVAPLLSSCPPHLQQRSPLLVPCCTWLLSFVSFLPAARSRVPLATIVPHTKIHAMLWQRPFCPCLCQCALQHHANVCHSIRMHRAAPGGLWPRSSFCAPGSALIGATSLQK